MDKKKTPLFADILLSITEEGRQKMQQDPKWDAINSAKDPLQLFELAKKVHLTSLSAGKMTVNDKTIARHQFDNLHQSQYRQSESVTDYFKRYRQAAIDAKDAVKVSPLTEEET